MTSGQELWRTTTGLELTTVVERGGRISIRLADREVSSAQLVPGRDPADSRIWHDKVLDALAQLLVDQLHPGSPPGTFPVRRTGT
ncbi:hypothetical protein [Frankia gtarii]|uniref:hypothetical protein n=1 Tax=Frankia gtarii TaxID=2950102 RepID=UPI0021BFC16F|nr:hypothetical protein [Frankia gtarii]